MKGAREYSGLDLDGLYGRLYISTGEHARGKTMQVFVMPENIEYRDNNKPKLNDAVCVYDAVSGQRGWTETYGWTKEGKWQDDFKKIVDEAKTKKAKRLFKAKVASDNSKKESIDKDNSLLSSY